MSTLPLQSTTLISNSFSTFLNKTPQPFPTNRKPTHVNVPIILCKASNDHGHDKQISTGALLGELNRRNVLIGLGGLYGTTNLSAATAAPIAAPDLRKCGSADLPAGAKPVDCCPPLTKKPVDFVLPRPVGQLRIRPAAEYATKEYIAKYEKAISLMKALPEDDPRTFKQQADIHCAYCDGAYDQVGYSDLELQVHNCWLFLPFHRWYVYFYERILGKLIDDPNFSVPFWNWDNPAGMQMPAMFTNPNSPLYSKLRDAKHQPPALIDLDYDLTDPTITAEEQYSSNLALMYRQMVSNGRTAKLFMGSPYRAGDDPSPGQGSLENQPHGTVHIWTGDRTQPNIENMGTFYSAARDPIFYAHHSNVDRMWFVWNKTLERKNFKDGDWLNATFHFYDENANLVKVKVSDCLDTAKLGYTYQEVELPWLKSRPKKSSKSKVKVSASPKAGTAQAAEISTKKKMITSVTESDFPVTLNKPLKTTVKRPKKSRSKKEKEEEVEVLLIEGIKLDREGFVKFDVYVNEDEEAEEFSRPDKPVFAGTFVNVPHKHKKGKKMKIKTCLRLGISDLLEDLEAEDDETVEVALVPRRGSEAVTVDSVKIVLESE
ncbi:Polyphenol oxidase, C-terminal [Dillenia turbinata]|uniref:Polyphenol oxidase, C-terminal n=1 Tax=Dillenia turbinata TaxID=194707 RepID=A0AAN8ZBX9_9MAGN